MSLPITLIVDDPAPLINVYWWHVAEPGNTDRPLLASGEPVARDIPVGFLQQFVDVVQRWGVRGKFSVLPFPAGLGPIDQGWPGCDEEALERWLDLVRRHVAPSMDITPEILTHARALDLDTMTRLDEDERHWSRHQNVATMAPYIGRALEILNRVGLPATGVTSPWDFGAEVEEEYRAAIRQALSTINCLDRSWYFLHSDSHGTTLRSQVVWRSGASWQVSIWAQVSDFLWDTMVTPEAGEEYVSSVADAYLTRDGRGGRLMQLFAAGTPMVLCTHWQSLFSNGRRTGLRILDEVCRRAARCWAEEIEWTRCSDLAATIAASDPGRGAGS